MITVFAGINAPDAHLSKQKNFFWMCRASANDQSPDIPINIQWILGNSIRPV